MEPPEGASKLAWKILRQQSHQNARKQASTLRRKRKRSGERFAHQQTGYGCSHKPAWQLVQCAAAAPTLYAGVGP